MKRPADTNPISQRRWAPGNPGLTLIEMLIVLSIISIMAMSVFPTVLKSQTRGRVARANADLHSLGTALEAYWIENRAYPPNRVEMAPATPGAPQPEDWPVVLVRRLEIRPALWLCETERSWKGRLGGVAPNAIEDCPVYYNGAGLTALTTPVAHVGRLPRDLFVPKIWRRRTVSASLDSEDDPMTVAIRRLAAFDDAKRYGYLSFSARKPEGVDMPSFGRTANWVLTGFGPDRRPSFTDPRIAFPALYDPTNGAVSPGDLILVGGL